MIPTIETFPNSRTAQGANRSIPLEMLRAACATWARKRNAPFPEIGALEDALRRRGMRIVMAGWAPIAKGIGLTRPNPTAEAMRRIAGAPRD